MKKQTNLQYNQEEYKELELKDAFTVDFDYNFVNDNIFGQNLHNDNAKQFLSFRQKIFIAIAFVLITFSIYTSPVMVVHHFLISVNICYLLILGFRVYIILIGKKTNTFPAFNYQYLSQELPKYTILVPLHHEEKVLAQLMKNLEMLDYPTSKLQILLILEETDQITQKALQEIKLKEHFHVIIVPYSYPQTKSKACNFALKYVSGDYLTIYDAEDKPDREQLRKAVAYLESSNDNIVCQSVLNYYNMYENWLTQMFSLEYAILFERILPAFQMLNLPIPLGGTSNHFNVKKLKALGGWDAYNVTEDADLGVRLAQNQFQVKMLPSVTEEESPITIKSWLLQRSRWIKGFIQTYFVHMRSPIKLYNSLGFKGFIAFNLLFGVANLLHILLPLTLTLSCFVAADTIDLDYFQMRDIRLMGYGSLIFGVFSLIWSSHEIKNSFTVFKKIRYWYSYPLYLLLMPVASMISIYQIITKLHFWQKTEHGITCFKQPTPKN